MTSAADLPCAFKVPELTGEIFRRLEYPQSLEALRSQGAYPAPSPDNRRAAGLGGYAQPAKEDDICYFPTMPAQITKIGQAAFWIQEDPELRNEDVLCVLDSLDYDVMFGDNGCIYFFGGDEWRCDCY